MDPKADFNFMMELVLRMIPELIMKAADADAPEEVARQLRNVCSILDNVSRIMKNTSNKGRKKASAGATPYKIAEDMKAIFVVRCWLAYKDGVFAKRFPLTEKDKDASNFQSVMNWLGGHIGEDFSDVEQLLQHALEREDIVSIFQDDIKRLCERIEDKRRDREAKNRARNNQRDREKR